MQDLESALTFIFTREIVIKKILHKENLERFVGLLVQVSKNISFLCKQTFDNSQYVVSFAIQSLKKSSSHHS